MPLSHAHTGTVCTFDRTGCPTFESHLPLTFTAYSREQHKLVLREIQTTKKIRYTVCLNSSKLYKDCTAYVSISTNVSHDILFKVTVSSFFLVSLQINLESIQSVTCLFHLATKPCLFITHYQSIKHYCRFTEDSIQTCSRHCE